MTTQGAGVVVGGVHIYPQNGDAAAFINGFSSFILCIFASFLLNLNKPINGD